MFLLVIDSMLLPSPVLSHTLTTRKYASPEQVSLQNREIRRKEWLYFSEKGKKDVSIVFL